MIELDMKMPPCCYNCLALEFFGDYPYCVIAQKYECYHFDIYTKRMSFCPLKDKEPRMLTLDEVKAIGTQNFNQMRDENTRLIWSEERTTNALRIVKPTYHDFELEDSEEEPIIINYMGTDFFDNFNQKTYGKDWRCWSTKPTEEQRESVKWAG